MGQRIVCIFHKKDVIQYVFLADEMFDEYLEQADNETILRRYHNLFMPTEPPKNLEDIKKLGTFFSDIKNQVEISLGSSSNYKGASLPKTYTPYTNLRPLIFSIICRVFTRHSQEVKDKKTGNEVWGSTYFAEKSNPTCPGCPNCYYRGGNFECTGFEDYECNVTIGKFEDDGT